MLFYASGGGDYSGRWLAHERTEICLDVSGLRCGSCVSKLERALLSVDGALEVGTQYSYEYCGVLLGGSFRAYKMLTDNSPPLCPRLTTQRMLFSVSSGVN